MASAIVARKIDQETLKSLLHYNPDTGIFTWLVSPSIQVKAGMIAGKKDRQGYVHISVANECHRAHRLAFLYMTGSLPVNHVDHIDHVRDNNAFSNLRDVTEAENFKNLGLSKRNTSGVNGVTWNKSSKRWQAYGRVSNKYKYIGVYKTIEEAAAARQAHNVMHGFHQNHGLPSEVSY